MSVFDFGMSVGDDTPPPTLPKFLNQLLFCHEQCLMTQTFLKVIEGNYQMEAKHFILLLDTYMLPTVTFWQTWCWPRKFVKRGWKKNKVLLNQNCLIDLQLKNITQATNITRKETNVYQTMMDIVHEWYYWRINNISRV